MADHLTLRSLLSRTSDVVGRSHEAKWLCEVATSLDGDEFVSALDEPVTTRMVAHLDDMVARYRAGEPLQYVLGRWSFRRLDLAIDRRVLIPRPETELVAAVAIEIAAAIDGPRKIADLGTGSGAIGLALADELPLADTTVWITDASDDALSVARANLAGLGRPARNVRVAAGSWFEALPVGDRFDVIVSDLAASAEEWEPASALFAGRDGLEHLRVLIAGAPAHLVPGGWLVLEIGADQARAVTDLFGRAGYEALEIRHDLAGHDRIALARTAAQ
jgi:release factor glutamine methyltransferase